jgi:hypothetical protein
LELLGPLGKNFQESFYQGVAQQELEINQSVEKQK